MNVICTKCGGTKVSCEAMIDPNTKEFHNYTDESFQYGWCGKCGHGTVLTDTDEVKEDIDRIYQRYVEEKKEEPEYAVCVVVWKDDNNSEHVKIRLSSVPMKRMIFSSTATASPVSNHCANLAARTSS